MDGPEKKKFSEKRPPDKQQRNKPKYVPKEEAEQQLASKKGAEQPFKKEGEQPHKKEEQPAPKKVQSQRRRGPQQYHEKL